MTAEGLKVILASYAIWKDDEVTDEAFFSWLKFLKSIEGRSVDVVEIPTEHRDIFEKVNLIL